MGNSDWQLRDTERIVTGNERLLGKKHLLVGLTRIRNETLLLPDTLDYLAGQVDAIVAYDDASTDETVEILRAHPKVALIVANQAWEQDVGGAEACRRDGIEGCCSKWRAHNCRMIGCYASIPTSA